MIIMIMIMIMMIMIMVMITIMIRITIMRMPVVTTFLSKSIRRHRTVSNPYHKTPTPKQTAGMLWSSALT